jgi:hypothetical protein
VCIANYHCHERILADGIKLLNLNNLILINLFIFKCWELLKRLGVDGNLHVQLIKPSVFPVFLCCAFVRKEIHNICSYCFIYMYLKTADSKPIIIFLTKAIFHIANKLLNEVCHIRYKFSLSFQTEIKRSRLKICSRAWHIF